MMSEFTKPIEDLGKNTADYVEARIDDLKLRTAKGLSLTLGKLLYMLLVLFIVSVILTALAIGGVMWIGELIGSYAAGAGIVAAVFAVILAVVVLLRKRLFRNTFVPMFIKLFFDGDKLSGIQKSRRWMSWSRLRKMYVSVWSAESF